MLFINRKTTVRLIMVLFIFLGITFIESTCMLISHLFYFRKYRRGGPDFYGRYEDDSIYGDR